MAKPKTQPTEAGVDSFLNGVADVQQRADALQLLAIMKEVTGQPAKMWGPTMIGFGQYHYVYSSGHEGDTFCTGFSPRKGALTVYFMPGLEERFAAQLQKLGKFKTGKGCLYIKKLEDIDLAVLREMIQTTVVQLAANLKEVPEAAPTKRGRKRS